MRNMSTTHCHGAACCGPNECACDVDLAAYLHGQDPCFGCTYAEANYNEREEMEQEWKRREDEEARADNDWIQEEDDAIERAFGEE